MIFMNGGDLFADADILSSVAKAIKAENPDFIYGDALETGGFYKKARSHTKLDWGMFTHHQAMVYKRGVVKDLRYDSASKIAADYGFTARFLRSAKNIHYIPCAICLFEEGGVSQRQKRTGRMEQFGIRKKLKICPGWKNRIVYTVQSGAALLRETMPGVYKFCRGKKRPNCDDVPGPGLDAR